MSIKSFPILWIKLQMEEKKHINLSIPVPISVIQEILDGTLDLLQLICLFKRNRYYTNTTSSISINTIKELLLMTMKLLDSLTEGEPYDLVNVAADKVKVSIKIK